MILNIFLNVSQIQIISNTDVLPSAKHRYFFSFSLREKESIKNCYDFSENIMIFKILYNISDSFFFFAFFFFHALSFFFFFFFLKKKSKGKKKKK